MRLASITGKYDFSGEEVLDGGKEEEESELQLLSGRKIPAEIDSRTGKKTRQLSCEAAWKPSRNNL